MAEFQNIIIQINRMCDKHTDTEECINTCPLALLHHKYLDAPSCKGEIFVHAKEVEQMVSEWAAKNPEPVYPTWAEWLLKVGAARRVPIGEPWPVELADGSMLEPCCETVVKENERIPADIAERLRIEPREG